MNIKDTNGWFLFTFTRADYRQHGELRINTFLTDLRLAVAPADRHYYEENNEWQIRETQRKAFDTLVQKHFMRDQFNLFG